MTKIGIIAAMAPEMDQLLAGMENVSEVKLLGIRFYIGNINNKNVVLSLSGVGKVNAAMAATVLINHFNCDLIINSGIAGGTAPLKKRDSVIATKLSYHDFDVSAFGYSYGQVPGLPKEFIVNPALIVLLKKVFNKLGLDYKNAPIVSGDKFVTDKEVLKNVEYESGYAVEMEGAGIAQVCIKAGVDFVVLRYISDIIGEENQQEDYNKFELEMANRSAEVTLSLLENIDD